MLSNQYFAVKNLVLKSQARSLIRVRCLSKEQQQAFNKFCCFRMNSEGIRCISTTVRLKPVELIKKGDKLFKNIYMGSCLSFDRSIHSSPTSYQSSNQDPEKRKNYIFLGFTALFVLVFIILSLCIEDHADYVKVK